MASDKGNRASFVEDGKIHPSSGDNGGRASGSEGLNLSAVDQVRVLRARARASQRSLLPCVSRVRAPGVFFLSDAHEDRVR